MGKQKGRASSSGLAASLVPHAQGAVPTVGFGGYHGAVRVEPAAPSDPDSPIRLTPVRSALSSFFTRPIDVAFSLYLGSLLVVGEFANCRLVLLLLGGGGYYLLNAQAESDQVIINRRISTIRKLSVLARIRNRIGVQLV
jgi:hypothetical protein